MLASFTYDVSIKDATLNEPNTVEPDGWATAVVLVKVLPRYGTDVALVQPVKSFPETPVYSITSFWKEP